MKLSESLKPERAANKKGGKRELARVQAGRKRDEEGEDGGRREGGRRREVERTWYVGSPIVDGIVPDWNVGVSKRFRELFRKKERSKGPSARVQRGTKEGRRVFVGDSRNLDVARKNQRTEHLRLTSW